MRLRYFVLMVMWAFWAGSTIGMLTSPRQIPLTSCNTPEGQVAHCGTMDVLPVWLFTCFLIVLVSVLMYFMPEEKQ